MKKIMALGIVFLPLFLLSQATQPKSTNGIQWAENLTWEQVKQKAKEENKYIFVDCYTTWCGPCKRMDKEVYPNDTVGYYFNDKFISIKLQIDQTSGDNDYVKAWYETARKLEKEFRVRSYPTFVFLSPDGTMVHKEAGFKLPADFVLAGQTAVQPGKIYDNPNAKYDQFVKEYNEGHILQFSDLPFIVQSAQELGDTALRQHFIQEFKSRMKSVPMSQLYTKENIEFIASLNLSSKSEFFPIFFKNTARVNNIMQKKHYSEKVIDKIILHEDISKFLNIDIVDVWTIEDGGRPIEKRPEPDWHQLSRLIKDKYGKLYATRNLLDAKIIWYGQQKDYESYARNFSIKYKKYGIDASDIHTFLPLNGVAWQIFLHCNDISLFAAPLEWMEVINRQCAPLKRDKFNPSYKAAMLDTYACLLYKAGRTSEAIQWEQKAITVAALEAKDQATVVQIEKTLQKMKNAESIW